jgi:hypothetical protein
MSLRVEIKNAKGETQHTLIDHKSSAQAERIIQRQNQRLNKNVLRKILDGSIIGEDGVLYPPETRLRNAAAHGASKFSSESIIYINGIGTGPATAYKHMRFLSKAFECPVHCIYNSSKGLVRDLFQCFGDKLNLGMNSAVKTLTAELVDILREGRGVKLMAHSQGALIVSRAIKRAIRTLQKDGISTSDLESKLGKIHVTTMGGAAWTYPNGPKYLHLINLNDYVPIQFGVGTCGLTRNIAMRLLHESKKSLLVSTLLGGLRFFNSPVKEAHAGEGAVIKHFLCEFGNNPLRAHRAMTYIKHLNSLGIAA